MQLYSKQWSFNRYLGIITEIVGYTAKELGIQCSTEGCIYGNLSILYRDGNLIECCANGEGVRVPYDCDSIEYLRSEAKLVLLIEKDSVFRY